MQDNKKRGYSFTLEADLGSGWSSDNREKTKKDEKILAVDKHELVIKKEKRKGKNVTLAGEFFHSKEIKQKLLAELKKKLSVGGSVSDTWLELQGDVAAALKPLLQARGYKVKG